jgi:hypothetical protein
MAKIRVIKRNDGVIQTQHRGDERYDETTLPPGTTPKDIAAEVIVDAGDLAGVEDTQAQIDIAEGRLVKDLARKPLHVELDERRRAAAVVLRDLDKDEAVEPAVKKYLVALRDHLNIGPSGVEHRQPETVETEGR